MTRKTRIDKRRDKLWKFRARLARHYRSPGWDKLDPAWLADRKIGRSWQRRLIASKSFAAVAASSASLDDLWDILNLLGETDWLLVDSIGADFPGMKKNISPRELAAAWRTAKKDAAIAARVLRNYAKYTPLESKARCPNCGQGDAQESMKRELGRIADEMERGAQYAGQTVGHSVLFMIFDFDKFGMRGGAADKAGAVRGYLIRELDRRLPEVPNRYATIAGLIRASGHDVTPVLVRSVLKKGRT